MRTFSLIICADLVCRVESEHGRHLRKRREEWRKKVFLPLLACHVALCADNVNSCTHEHTRCMATQVNGGQPDADSDDAFKDSLSSEGDISEDRPVRTSLISHH